LDEPSGDGKMEVTARAFWARAAEETSRNGPPELVERDAAGGAERISAQTGLKGSEAWHCIREYEDRV
jgi:hypothetical protein